MDMKNDIIETIEIPQGTDAILEGSSLTLKKGGIESKKSFKISNVEVNIRKEGSKIILEAKKATRNESKIINTIRAHINNMILGMDKKYVYKLKVCSVHFPNQFSPLSKVLAGLQAKFFGKLQAKILLLEHKGDRIS